MVLLYKSFTWLILWSRNLRIPSIFFAMREIILWYSISSFWKWVDKKNKGWNSSWLINKSSFYSNIFLHKFINIVIFSSQRNEIYNFTHLNWSNSISVYDYLVNWRKRCDNNITLTQWIQSNKIKKV
jgi:hypothetical protein